jgi:hypothetical protein
MAVFVSVTTDAFDEQFAKKRERAPQINVRRPLRGIQVKKDTYAVLRVLTATGKDIPLFDSGSTNIDGNGVGTSTYYSNYIVQQISESRAEKQQIIETFGEDYVYFFGEQPRFLDVRGCLINTADFNWKSEFWANYEQNLRGTRLVEQNARVYFYFDDVVVEGYILSANTTATSDNPHMLPFSFQIFISNYAILSTVGHAFIPTSDQSATNTALEPFTLTERRENAAAAARLGSPGGLGGFLAAASQFAQNADFAIQETLEIIKTFFYGKRVAVPDGLDSQITIEPVTNEAKFDKAPTGRPIHEMADEYVERMDQSTQGYDQMELARAEAIMSIQDPVTLDAKARADLAVHGVDVSKPTEVMILLGRGAFAALQYTAPMALGLTGGNLGVVDQGISTVL